MPSLHLPALALILSLAACGGGSSAPATATTPTLPGDPSATSDTRGAGAGGAADADDGAEPGPAPISDEDLVVLIDGSISMTEQMVAAAREANKDCPLMAQKLEAVFTANADLMARGAALRDQRDIDARMEKALDGARGERAGAAQEALGVELEACSDSEEVAKLFERLYE